MEFNKLLILLLINVFPLFTSCTKDVINVKLPDFEQKLFICSFISPGLKANEIAIGCSKSDFGKLSAPDMPGNIVAIISDGTNEVRIDTVLNDSNYFHNKIRIRNIPIIEGQTYQIKVINEKGLTNEASCTVPLHRDFHIKVDTTITFTQNTWTGEKYSSVTAKISMTDFPGETNYYRLIFSVNGISMVRPVEDVVLSDKGKEGQEFVLQSVSFQSTPVRSTYKDSAFLRIYLLNTNKEYYDYHKSYLTATLGKIGPFTEPSALYSNASNGVGIFAAYTIDSLIFRLK
jgi:hypothetical protein